jgi:hypothetical protein
VRFRKRPVEVEAVRYTGENINEVWDTFGSGVIYGPGGMHSRPPHSTDDRGAYVETLEGVMCANPGDWIIRGVKGEIYPCKPEIFEATYEAL